MNKWEQAKHATEISPEIWTCYLMTLIIAIAVLFLHRYMKKKGFRYRDHMSATLICGFLCIMIIASYTPYHERMHEELGVRTGVLHFGSGRDLRPFFLDEDGRKEYLDFSLSKLQMDMKSFWNQEITVYYDTSNRGMLVYQVEYQGKMVISLEESNSFIWLASLGSISVVFMWTFGVVFMYFFMITSKGKNEGRT